MHLSLAYSPCPNDTYIFHALATGLVSAGSTPGGEDLTFDVTLADIEALNGLAASGLVDVAKVSYAAYGLLADEYVLLRSGGALGHRVGPLVVSRRPDLDLAGARVAIPGGRTTANLLLRLLRTDVELVEMRYDAIMPAVAAGSVDAGLIIHESRFTYQDHGLHSLL
ncbi:MAG TPA: MqnA/MqnD/SBP family protein, partial [Trueperaceae bacterium]|nr:MqnA/MqnD/SBP family protein [Trueperaceae bacterium]